MALDNRATDGQPDHHAVALRRVEGFEEPVYALRIETHPRIPNDQAYTIALVPSGSDHQLSGAVIDVPHRVRGVPEQVQDDLLKLDAIAFDGRKVVGKLRPQNYAGSLKFAQ